MTDTKGNNTGKADIKGARRASFARALHVPSIARRVKHVELMESSQARTSSPSRKSANGNGNGNCNGVKTPQRSSNPMPTSVPVEALEVDHNDEGGAEIPDIPLRRTSNSKRISVDPSLTTLERILAEGGSRDLLSGPYIGPINPNSVASRSGNMYDDQGVVSRELPGFLPLKRSLQSSLPDVPEVSPTPTVKGDADAYSEDQEKSTLPPRREGFVSSEPSVDLSASSVEVQPHASSPYQKSQAQAIASSSDISTSERPDLSSSLPALQTKGVEDGDGLEPVAEDDLDPGSFDLIVPTSNVRVYSLERRSELLFSVEHLRMIFDDPILLNRFTSFLNAYRPSSVPLLCYYLDLLKAIRGLEWVNAVILQAHHLDGQSQYGFAPTGLPEMTVNKSLLQKAEAAFEALARDDLPAYITNVWTEVVEVSMRRRITGKLPAHLRHMSEGLAEVFCITDPSRADNPIVFASEEFHRTTHYGSDYVMGRNCRFLQGPKTNPFAIKRIREKLDQGKEHYETFLNYRRDGLPFMNLLMCTPLFDSRGKIRYFLGAQVDVSGLAKACSGLESLRRLVDKDEEEQRKNLREEEQSQEGDAYDISATSPVGTATTTWAARDPKSGEKKDEFRLLCEMFGRHELETARRFGGRMHRSQQEQVQHMGAISNWHKPRVLILADQETSPPTTPSTPQRQTHALNRGPELTDANGNISISSSRPQTSASQNTVPSSPGAGPGPGPANGSAARLHTIYEHYLVVRPYPSLRILFASPSLRVPGILQSHLMSRIGGSRRLHEELEQAFAMGHGVTAKVKWISGGVARSTSNLSSASSLDDDSRSTHSSETIGKEGRPRWIHCTPLTGSNGTVGVWVVVIVDEEGDADAVRRAQRERTASVISTSISGKLGGKTAKDRGGLAWDDSMRLVDFAAMNRLPEDEDLRQHFKDMYEAARRRERLGGGFQREWEKGWAEGRLPSDAGAGRDRDRDREGEGSRLRGISDGDGGAASGRGRDGSRTRDIGKDGQARRFMDGQSSRSSSPYTLHVDEHSQPPQDVVLGSRPLV